MQALIIEPSRTVASTLAVLFRKYGIEPRITKAGGEALQALEQHAPDLLCFAYELGDMNGVDFYISAKARKLLRHQPGLMFTSTHRRSVINRAIEAGVTQCFSKNKPEQLEYFIERFSISHRCRTSGDVLLVEDSGVTAQYYKEVLLRLGLRVDICNSAEDAIQRIEAHHYDLVVTDYLLAGSGTGFTVINAVRESPGKIAATPILAISSFDDTARKVEILRSGANDFVAKPVIAEELEVRVLNLLHMRQLMHRLESQHDQMRHLAMRDQLTSLHNRYYLNEEMPGLIADAEEHVAPLSLLAIDVDNFKAINDRHGHQVGDKVLSAIARLIQDACRNDDLVARIGGEEFVAALPGVTLQNAADRAETIRRQAELLYPAGIACTLSIGVTTLLAGDRYDDLFHRADAALYGAKQLGRNRINVAASDHQMPLESDFR